MNRRRLFSYFLWLCAFLAGCGSNPVTKPTVLLDAESYTNSGIQAFVRADWKQAEGLFTRALFLYQGIDDQLGVLSSHINLAEVALSMRDYPTVDKNLDRASEIASIDFLQQHQPRITLLYALNTLQQKKISQAKSHLQILLPGFDGDTLVSVPDIIQVTAIANRTKIAFIQKQDETLWTQRYAKGLDMLTDKNIDLEARLLRFQSRLLQQQKLYEESEFKLLQALSAYKKTLSRSGIAMTLLELGRFYSSQERWQDAQNHLNRSIEVFRYLGDFVKVKQVKESLVKVEVERRNLEQSKVQIRNK